MIDKIYPEPVLNTPIQPPDLLFEDDFSQRFRRDVDERFDALFAHSGIERGSPAGWMLLAMELARAHVPGFQVDEAEPQTQPRREGETRGRKPTTGRELFSLAAFASVWKHRDPSVKRRRIAEKVANERLLLNDQGSALGFDRVRQLLVDKRTLGYAVVVEQVLKRLGEAALIEAAFGEISYSRAAQNSEWKKALAKLKI